MSYLLDTCTISQLRKEIPEKTLTWFNAKANDLFYVSVVTVAELWDGIERLPKSKKKVQLEDWFHGDFYTRFHEQILPIDDHIAKEWGTINAGLVKKGIHVGVQDLYIAATAKAHGFILVTLNTKDFSSINIEVVNPWEWL